MLQTTKIKGGRTFRKVFRLWTKEDLEKFKAFHGHERNDDCKGLYHWIAENQIEQFLKANPTAKVIK